MSAIVVGGRAYAAGLYWLSREGARATARTARRLNRPWCVHHGGRTGFAAVEAGAKEGPAGPGPEGRNPAGFGLAGLPALAAALLEHIEDGFWMALVERGDADPSAAGGPDGGEGRYALVKARDGAVLADGDEVFDDRAAALAAFGRARNLGWSPACHAGAQGRAGRQGRCDLPGPGGARRDGLRTGGGDRAGSRGAVRGAAAGSAGGPDRPRRAGRGGRALAGAGRACGVVCAAPTRPPLRRRRLPNRRWTWRSKSAALIAACRRALVENPPFMPGWLIERIDCTARFADAEVAAAVPGLAGRAVLLVRWRLAPGHAGAVQRRVAEAHLRAPPRGGGVRRPGLGGGGRWVPCCKRRMRRLRRSWCCAGPLTGASGRAAPCSATPATLTAAGGSRSRTRARCRAWPRWPAGIGGARGHKALARRRGRLAPGGAAARARTHDRVAAAGARRGRGRRRPRG